MVLPIWELHIAIIVCLVVGFAETIHETLLLFAKLEVSVSLLSCNLR